MTHKTVEGSAAAVPADLVRLSCGVEASEDLIADLAQAIGVPVGAASKTDQNPAGAPADGRGDASHLPRPSPSGIDERPAAGILPGCGAFRARGAARARCCRRRVAGRPAPRRATAPRAPRRAAPRPRELPPLPKMRPSGGPAITAGGGRRGGAGPSADAQVQASTPARARSAHEELDRTRPRSPATASTARRRCRTGSRCRRWRRPRRSSMIDAGNVIARSPTCGAAATASGSTRATTARARCRSCSPPRGCSNAPLTRAGLMRWGEAGARQVGHDLVQPRPRVHGRRGDPLRHLGPEGDRLALAERHALRRGFVARHPARALTSVGVPTPSRSGLRATMQ